LQKFVVISVRKQFRLIWFFAFLLDFPLPVQAEVEDGTHIDPAIVQPLMGWVESQLGVKVPSLPQVMASHSRFARVLGRMEANFAGRPQSAYVPGTIYLDNNRWDPGDSTQLSLLVHELVHHAQLFMRTPWPCHQAKETQAYTLQNKWLEQQGHSPFVNAAWIERVASCPDRGAVSLLAQR
jgi:hypothetical protein